MNFIDSFYNDNLINSYLDPIIENIGKNIYKENYNYIISNNGLNDIKNNIISDNKKIIITKNNIIINYYIDKFIPTTQFKDKQNNNIIIKTGNDKNNSILDIRDYILQGFKIQNIKDCKLKEILNN